MQDFLHRLKIHLVGEAGLLVFGIISLFGTLFLFAVSPVLAVLFLAVMAFVGWRFMRWIKVQDAHYKDTEGRIRCRRCPDDLFGHESVLALLNSEGLHQPMNVLLQSRQVAQRRPELSGTSCLQAVINSRLPAAGKAPNCMAA